MVHHNNYSGRLFLAKGKEHIYVDVNQLLQHQIEGIRFLYRQFKKKKSGVILNDPTSSGKTHQVVLFLKAINCLLTKPILILCSSHEKNHWLTHFLDFTDLTKNGVLVEPPNLNTKRMSICIDTKSNLTSLVHHDWSIVVIDDDSAVNEVLKRVFKTEYKIWITSVDMKTNLEAFWSIFAWLCPKEKKEDVQKLTLKFKDTQNSIAKQIFLDAVMEDVVLRRTNSFSSSKKQKVADMEINTTRKNKDASGTKIKKSKTKSTTEKSSIISNKPTIILENTVNNYENNDNDLNMDEIYKDQNKVEPMTTDKEKFIEHTETANNCEPKELDGLESMTIINNELENEEHSKIELNNDVSYDADDIIKMKNNETPEIVTELKTPLMISDDSKVVDNILNVSNRCKEIDYEENKLHMIDTNEQSQCDKNIENTNKSSYKTFDEVMRESEQKALKKFKGSLLDSIF